MSKRKQKFVENNVDSVLKLLQEVYFDLAEQKTQAFMIMKKMLKTMVTQEDLALIGPIIKDQQKIINDCTQKKLALIKLQTTLLKYNVNTDTNDLTISDDDRELIDKLIKDENEINSNYSL